MALLYVFPVGEYIVIRDNGNVFKAQIHYSELSIERTSAGEIGFVHRRDTDAQYPIQSAAWNDIVDEAGAPYSVVDEDDFLTQFSSVLPTSGGGSTVSTAQQVEQNIRTTGDYTAASGSANQCVRIQIIALTGTFEVNGITYPITTANGVIDDFLVQATSGKLQDIAYAVNAASSVLEIIQY